MIARPPRVPVAPLVEENVQATDAVRPRSHHKARARLDLIPGISPATGEKTPWDIADPPQSADRVDEGVLKAYLVASGWLLDEYRTPGDLSTETAARIKDGRVPMARGNHGRIFQRDPDRKGKIIGFDPDRLPEGAIWQSLKRSPTAYFLKHVELSTDDPTAVVHDFIDAPQQQLDDAIDKLALAEYLHEENPGDAELQHAVTQLQMHVQTAARSQQALYAQFVIMRNGFFHTDDAENEAADRLAASGFDTAEFHRRAERACTPEDIEALKRDYLLDPDNRSPKRLTNIVNSDRTSPA